MRYVDEIVKKLEDDLVELRLRYRRLMDDSNNSATAMESHSDQSRAVLADMADGVMGEVKSMEKLIKYFHELKQENTKEHGGQKYLLVEQGGGIVVMVEGEKITTLSVETPLGRKLSTLIAPSQTR